MAYEAERKLIMAASPLRFDGAFIAGGAVTSAFTNAKINDVDVYFKSRRAFETGVYQAYEDGLWCVAASKRAVTFADQGRVAQLMHFDFFPTASDIFAAFDFTVCMGALDLDAGPKTKWNPLTSRFDTEGEPHPESGFVLRPDFMKHNSQRFLKFNPGTRYPLASATRVLKYQQRGYTIGKGDWEDEFGQVVPGECVLHYYAFTSTHHWSVADGKPECSEFREDPDNPARCPETMELPL